MTARSPSIGSGSGIRWTPGATAQAPGSDQWVPESGEIAWAVEVTRWTLEAGTVAPLARGGREVEPRQARYAATSGVTTPSAPTRARVRHSARVSA